MAGESVGRGVAGWEGVRWGEEGERIKGGTSVSHEAHVCTYTHTHMSEVSEVEKGLYGQGEALQPWV